MHNLTLLRDKGNETATIGAFYLDGIYVVSSLELPWKDNAQGSSCIPTGTYKMSLTHSRRFDRFLYELHDVPGRFGIRIHSANYTSQLHGCIAPGIDVKNYKTVDSRLAYEMLDRVIQANNIDELNILEREPSS